MRLAADPKSPHFRADYADVLVYVDGLRLSNVVELSDDEGWVDCLVGFRGEAPVIERLTGTVRLSRLLR